MKISLEAEKLSDGIWLAALSRDDALRIGEPKNSKNGCSVVLLKGSCTTINSSISFEPDIATLLNVGSIDCSVIIETKQLPSDTYQSDHSSKQGYATVKKQCEKHLPKDLAEKVLSMLDELSAETSDDLVADKTNRWISRPDNYFTLKVQPQNRDLVITIRGRPTEYESRILEIRADQNGYSRFWIRTMKDVQEAVRLIKCAHRRGRRR